MTATETWAADLLAAVEGLEFADRTFDRLTVLPPGPDDESRVAVLRRAWDGLKISTPTPLSTQARAEHLGGRIGLLEETVGWRFEAAMDALLAELARLYEAGVEPPGRPVLLASDFTYVQYVRLRSGLEGRIACPAGLPPGHLAHTVLPADQLFQSGGNKFLVLGDPRCRWYEVAAVRDRTVLWESVRLREVELEAEARKLEERRQKEAFDASEYGRGQRLEALEKELADLKAAVESRTSEQLAQLQGEISKLRAAGSPA